MNSKDARGTEITLGARVAYNMSGDVVAGEVVAVGRGGNGPYRIARDYECGYQRPDIALAPVNKHVSRVKNARSILVLREGER